MTQGSFVKYVGVSDDVEKDDSFPEAVNKRVFEYNEDILRKKQSEEEQKKNQQATIEQLRNRIKLLSQAQEA